MSGPGELSSMWYDLPSDSELWNQTLAPHDRDKVRICLSHRYCARQLRWLFINFGHLHLGVARTWQSCDSAWGLTVAAVAGPLSVPTMRFLHTPYRSRSHALGILGHALRCCLRKDACPPVNVPSHPEPMRMHCGCPSCPSFPYCRRLWTD